MGASDTGVGDANSGADLRDPQTAKQDRIPADVCVVTRSAAAASLKKQPRVLWQADVASRSASEGVALSADRIAVSAGHSMFLFDKTGKLRHRVEDPRFVWVSPPVADAQGNFYFAGERARSLDADGNMRWDVFLRDDDSRRTPPSSFVISPDGVIYSAQNDGALRAIAKDTGKTIWEQKVPSDPLSAHWINVVSGIGDHFVVDTVQLGFQIHDRSTGALRASVTDVEAGGNEVYAVAAAKGFGIIGSGIVDDMHGRVVLYDLDGRRKWASAARRMARPAFIDLDGSLVVSEHPEGQKFPAPTFLRRLPCGAEPKEPIEIPTKPQRRLTTFLLGADGVTYTTTFTGDYSHSSVDELIALDRDFKVLWTVELTGRRFLRRPALDTDGVLYFLVHRAEDDAAEVVAIQTTSPGPAPTPWAGGRSNAAQSGWASP